MFLHLSYTVVADSNQPSPQTAQLFAQCMNEKLPRAEGIPSEVRTWSNFVGGKLL